MDVLKILKILQKNLFLIIMVPAIMVVITKYLTRNVTLKYESETTIYTGLASGYSLDQSKGFNLFATNNQFDNLINIIKSREVASEVAIRLFTRNLMLNSYDVTYISKENYNTIQTKTPQYIKDLLIYEHADTLNGIIHSSAGQSETDSVFLESGDYIVNDKMFHVVDEDESIFSLSASYGIPVSELLNANELVSPVLRPGQVIIVKQAGIEDEGRNGMYKDTLHGKIVMSPKTVSLFERNVKRLMAYANESDTNYIYKLLNSSNAFYSVSAISSINVRRVQSSDLVTLKYTTFDPGICLQTLITITDVFIRKHKNINENQSDAVVRYFINEVNKSAYRLKTAEDRLLEFNKQNNIINYYEQSKAVANVKEELDMAYQSEQVRFESAAAVIKRLEDKLSQQQQIQLKTSEMLKLRTELSDVSTKLTISEIFQETEPKNRIKVEDLKKDSDKLKKDLQSQLQQLYNLSATTDGLAYTNILQNWLDNVVIFEESKAAMKVISARIRDFYEYYKTFAPLGATQKRIEREINVAEQEYLSLLHSLNLSKLKQQNIELSSNIKAVDLPYFPLKALKGKEGLLVIAAGMFGLLFVLFIILALEYLDNTIKTPERLELLTKLRIAGVFPKVIRANKIYNLSFIFNRLIELLVQNIHLQQNQIASQSSPFFVVVISPLPKEGKTFIISRLVNKMREFGDSVAFLTVEGKPSNISNSSSVTKPTRRKPSKLYTQSELIPSVESSPDNFYYKADYAFASARTLNDLEISGEKPFWNSYKVVFLELPSIINFNYPIELLKKSDVSILLVRSNRTWRKSDGLALNTIVKLLKEKPFAILNGVEMEVIDTVLGELPRKRTWIRRKFKRLISLQVHEKQNLS
ncbi:MAG: LysM peptidoglycan-binding domain-containing protein [Bacteroidales bacterium]|nr:LysM peptidoglycan-binding domain-containing protein [Bacteroidales bacterium]